MIWARRIGRAAIVVAYVVTDPCGAARAVAGVWREYRRDG